MARSLFSVPIFFIIFRESIPQPSHPPSTSTLIQLLGETVEAAIIVSVLLSFVEQLMLTGRLASSTSVADRPEADSDADLSTTRDSHDASAEYTETNPLLRRSAANTSSRNPSDGIDADERTRRLIARMKIQVWAGTGVGLLIATAIGAAFIAVVSRFSSLSTCEKSRVQQLIPQFYLELGDLWSETEQIWEGVFSAIASVLIYIMGIAFLKMDRSRIKWRYKLAIAFEKSHQQSAKGEAESQGGKWALFMLPFITVLREGLEAVVFVGGVSRENTILRDGRG